MVEEFCEGALVIHSDNALRRRAKSVVPLKQKRARPRRKTPSNAPGLPLPLPRHKSLVDGILADPDKAQYRHYQELYPNCKTSRVAANQASKILARPEVQEYMAEAQARIAKKAHKTQDDLAAELVSIGFATIADVMSWDEEGNITFTASDKLTRAQLAAIASVKGRKTIRTDSAGNTTERIEFEVKMNDKLDALKQFAKLTGMKPDDPAASAAGTKNIIVLPPLENEADQLKRMRIYDVTPGSG
jgi:hypothetical protein